jgi:hypothetical protein
MRSQFKVGDLIHVPSDVLLFNESKTHKLDKPLSLLVVGKKDNCYEVYFNGKSWYVEQSSAYSLKEKKDVKTYRNS